MFELVGLRGSVKTSLGKENGNWISGALVGLPFGRGPRLLVQAVDHQNKAAPKPAQASGPRVRTVCRKNVPLCQTHDKTKRPQKKIPKKKIGARTKGTRKRGPR